MHMYASLRLRAMTRNDDYALREVYADSIDTQGQLLYSREQIEVWKSLAWLPGVLDTTFREGKGWVIENKHEIEAFAVRYPNNRLALLYCRGRSTRQGFATMLLKKLTLEACKEGHRVLYAEASLFSYSLLLKMGWNIQSMQKIKIGGVRFDRYLMTRILDSLHTHSEFD